MKLESMGQRRRNTQQSSARHDWETPPAFFRVVQRVFGCFDLDAAASAENALCAMHFSAEDSGLHRPWGPMEGRPARVWCNPPYGGDLGDFVGKAYAEAEAGRASTVMLFPPRSDAGWWHDFVMRAAGVYPVRGRIAFCQDGVAHDANTFPSVLVWFHPLHLGGEGTGGPQFRTFCQRCGLDCSCRPATLL